MDHVPGTVYLLHLNQPYKHARHYLGWELARTWPGDRYRERQLKKQGGRARMCPVCKQHPRKKAMEPTPTPGRQDQAGNVIETDLPADLTSARHARAAIRQALTAWGLADPDGDAELLASELAANASEHARGPITLAVRRHAEPGRQPALTCEVTDASLQVPRPCEAGPGEERGRGLAIVSALAASSGVRASEAGKTTWFTLALRDRAGRLTRQAEAEAEAGA